MLMGRDFEWLDPSSITTQDGNLVITMTQESIHDLNFKSGMIQSWSASSSIPSHPTPCLHPPRARADP